MSRRIALLSLCLSLLCLPIPANSGDDFLGSPEIIALIKGNTAEGHAMVESLEYHGMKSSVRFKILFRPDGALVEVPSAQVGAHTELTQPIHGKWWSRKGWLCFRRLDSARDPGKKRCWRVARLEDDGTYGLYSKDGTLRQTWDRLLPGDPYGLASK